ncbi:MAG: phytanoyl-CoA dioxygenase [Candidatus Rokuibacteriota bacterium]|nr:MAG: phytanoyl-CoA dioxygenase [Candidatus Rokubacteria bacterium]
MATTSVRHLTAEQIAAYHRDGYLAVRDVIDPTQLEALRAATDEFVEQSRRVTSSGPVFDLDPRHTAERPILRRIKNPADNHALYRWVAFESPIPAIVAELIGPDVKFHHSKLNLKGEKIGAPVEWHQDAAFYPHSNDDVLAVGLLLDDATPENGCLAVLPGSHRGPVYDHYEGDAFTGSINRADLGRLDLGRAVPLPLPAGSIHIHHYRAVHGSAENRSSAPRRLLINSYSAADAIPFTPDTQHSPLYGRIVCGAPAVQFRRTAAEWRMPPTWDHGYTSIYELQGRAGGAPGAM